MMKLCHVLQVTPNDLLMDELLIARQEIPEQLSISPRALLQELALLLRKQEKP